ncbi:hypothetical protein DRH27_05330 [Candidatus Falkowbacteria bacterium]|nr:MAG: hypothetical protein DRH27_05330 [Candidatus Falkowbacteria bacterium]
MKFNYKKIIYWFPRVLGLLFAFFMSLFATEIFNEGYSVLKTIIGFLIQLIPALIILVFTAIGWKKDAWGTALFTILAIAYILYFKNQPWQTYVIISAPLFLIGVLFLLNKIFGEKKEKPAEKGL